MECEDSNTNLEDETFVQSFCQPSTELQNMLLSAMENVLEQVTNADFSDVYKTCLNSFEKKDEISKPSLRGSTKEAMAYRKQFNDIVMGNLKETIEETVTRMDSNLKELEDLKNSQTDTSFVWRPPGDALEHIKPFDYASKLEEKNELETKLEKMEEEIDLLKARLIQKRRHAISLHETLKSNMNDYLGMVCDKVTSNQ